MGLYRKNVWFTVATVLFVGQLFISGKLLRSTAVVNPLGDKQAMPQTKGVERRILNTLDISTWEQQQHVQSNAINDSPVSDEWDDQRAFITRRESEYKRRKERVGNVCRQQRILTSPASDGVNSFDNSSGIEHPSIAHFSMVKPFRTMSCLLNKVASSSLVSAFLVANGFEARNWASPHSMVSFLRPLNLQDFHQANETYFKFLFVRHPMDRLLSCYLDKMVTSPHKSLPPYRRHIKLTAMKIMKKRQGSKLALPSLPKLPAAGIHQNTTAKDSVKPTFEEFLEFILNTNLQGVGYESHWVPYFRYCTPCSVQYDAIGKLETAADDFKYMWTKTGLISKTSIPWINRASSPSKDEMELKKRYYSSVPRDLILRVYARYRIDFEMFDYSINETLLKAGYAPL